MRCYKTIWILEQTYCHFTFLVCHLCVSLAKVIFFLSKTGTSQWPIKGFGITGEHFHDFPETSCRISSLLCSIQVFSLAISTICQKSLIYNACSCIVSCKEQWTCQRDWHHPSFYYTCWQFSDMQCLSFLFHSCPIYSMFPLAWCQWNLKQAAQCCYPSILVYRPHKSTLSIVHRPLPYFSMALFHSRGQPCKGFAQTVPTARIPISSR